MTEDDAELCRGHRVLAVNDAYRLFPWAEVLYGCDARWWSTVQGASECTGEKWISTDRNRWQSVDSVAYQFGLKVIQGRGLPFFSTDPRFIHYGYNSGYQAINLALLFGAAPLVLVGFDYRKVEGRSHFFGDHQKPLANTTNFAIWLECLDVASKKLPPYIQIINCTPDSAIESFPRGNLKEVLDGLAESDRTGQPAGHARGG